MFILKLFQTIKTLRKTVKEMELDLKKRDDDQGPLRTKVENLERTQAQQKEVINGNNRVIVNLQHSAFM